MIILEGTDCAGKTTTGLRLLEELAARRVLTGYKRYGFLPPTWDYCSHYLWDVKRHVVLDRFTLSEKVYGTLFRGGVNPTFTTLKQAVVARELQRVGALTVLFAPPLEEIFRRLRVRGDEHFNATQIGDAYTEFLNATSDGPRSWWDNTRLLVVTKGSPSEIVTEIIATYETHSPRTLSESCYGPTDETCQAIFIGQVCNPKGVFGGPPRAFCQGPGAEYLHDVITKLGFDPRRCFLANAVDTHGEKLPGRDLEWRKPEQAVFALGTTASKHLEELGVKHIAADHPNYTRRFFTDMTEGVVDYLRKELRKWNAR